jgi:hypothetical protein
MLVQASSLIAAIAAQTGLVWRTVIENRTSWARSRPSTFADQSPESARKMIGPVAPARRTRPIVSSTNRGAPRAVLALPVRWRAWRTSPVCARVASSGW